MLIVIDGSERNGSRRVEFVFVDIDWSEMNGSRRIDVVFVVTDKRDE